MTIPKIKRWGWKTFPAFWNVCNYSYWRIRLATPWTETAMFRQMRRVRKTDDSPAKAPPSRKKRVFFFATRQERDQVAMISMLSWALIRRGSSPVVLGCDQALTQSCNSGIWPAVNPWACRSCHRFAEHTLGLAGIQTDWLTQFITSTEREKAREAIAQLSAQDYPQFSYKGYPIGHMVRHSVAHFLRTDKILNDPATTKVYRNWLESAICLVDACESLLDKHRPDVVVILNGLFAPEWIMLEAAKRRGVRLVCWEVGFLPGTFIFQPERPTDIVNNDLWERFRDVPLTPLENERLDRYLSLRETGRGYLINYFPDLKDSTEEICREFGIDRSKKIVVLFPNITWDSACFEKDVGFKGLADWLTETIRFFASRSDAQLIVRVHPAEKILKGAGRDSVMALIRKQFPEPPSNVIVVPPDSSASSYVFMKLAMCGLVYGSTTGIEMGVRGIPVVVAGEVYYRGFGFTFDPATREEYRQLIDDILSERVNLKDKHRTEAWRRYAYFALFRSHIPLPQVRYESAGAPVQFGFDRMDALDRGQDPNLDVVCDTILNGTPCLTAQIRWEG